jgi:hypothetical protein
VEAELLSALTLAGEPPPDVYTRAESSQGFSLRVNSGELRGSVGGTSFHGIACNMEWGPPYLSG